MGPCMGCLSDTHQLCLAFRSPSCCLCPVHNQESVKPLPGCQPLRLCDISLMIAKHDHMLMLMSIKHRSCQGIKAAEKVSVAVCPNAVESDMSLDGSACDVQSYLCNCVSHLCWQAKLSTHITQHMGIECTRFMIPEGVFIGPQPNTEGMIFIHEPICPNTWLKRSLFINSPIK